MPVVALDLTVAKWLLVVAWGSFVGLDAVSWPQIMVSRPIVAGTVGGLIFGDATAGFAAGAFLEILSLRHPPFGAARYPEAGPAALVAGAGYAAAGGSGFLPLLATVLAGWTIGWVGSHSVHLQRTINGRLVGDPEEVSTWPRRITTRHHLAMRLDGIRAGLLTGAFLVPVAFVARLAAGFEAGPIGADWAAPLAAVGIAGAAGAGARGLSPGRTSWPLLLAGAGVGLFLFR